MKSIKTLIIATFIAGAFMFQACGIIVPTPLGPAGFYTNVVCPSAALAVDCSASVGQSKVGKASATNILGVVTTGDCSVTAAMQNGNIKRVHHVDIKYESVMGLFMTRTILVYGD